MTPAPTPGSERIWFAHALRGVAAALVLWEHLFVGWWQTPALATMFLYAPEAPPATPPADLFYLPAIGELGDLRVGVATFFVLSGFLIPLSLERRGPVRFLAGRAVRLYPVWIAATVLAGLTFALQAGALGRPSPFDGLTWLWNALLVNDILGHATANPAAWTLLVTVKFYVLCALLAPLGGTRRVAPVVGSLIILTTLALATERLFLDAVLAGHIGVATAIAAVGFTAPFICLIVTGVAIHNAVRGHWSTVTAVCVGAAALGAHAVGLYGGTLPPALAQPYLVSGCAGLAAFLLAYRLRTRIPRWRALDVMGRLSYSVYAIHYVVGGVLSLALYRATGWALASIVAAVAVVLALSWAVNRWIEEPTARRSRRQPAEATTASTVARNRAATASQPYSRST